MVYFVATPIGNLKDITIRAIEVLKQVDIIACEDTRHSKKLLNYYGINSKLISLHKFNEIEGSQKIVQLCQSGKTIAVISDAGTPLISDPGGVLVKELIDNKIDFTVIPGANAFVPALILSGFDTDKFLFFGFLTGRTGQRKKQLELYKNLQASIIFYSPPQDVDKDIKLLFEVFGNREAALVKEITKIYESCERFELKDGITGEKKGEHIIIVKGADALVQELSAKECVQYYIEKGYDKKTATKMAAKDLGVSKSEVYKKVIDIK